MKRVIILFLFVLWIVIPVFSQEDTADTTEDTAEDTKSGEVSKEETEGAEEDTGEKPEFDRLDGLYMGITGGWPTGVIIGRSVSQEGAFRDKVDYRVEFSYGLNWHQPIKNAYKKVGGEPPTTIDSFSNDRVGAAFLGEIYTFSLGGLDIETLAGMAGHMEGAFGLNKYYSAGEVLALLRAEAQLQTIPLVGYLEWGFGFASLGYLATEDSEPEQMSYSPLALNAGVWYQLRTGEKLYENYLQHEAARAKKLEEAMVILAYGGVPTGIGIGGQDEKQIVEFYLGTDWSTHALISSNITEWDYKERLEQESTLFIELGWNWIFPITSWGLNADASSRISWLMGLKQVLGFARSKGDVTGAPGIIALDYEWLHRFDFYFSFLEGVPIIPFIDLGIGVGLGAIWHRSESIDDEDGLLGFIPWTASLGVRLKM